MLHVIVNPEIAEEGSSAREHVPERCSVVGHRPSSRGEPDAGGRHADVWEDGPPAHISAATLRIDLQFYSHAKCGGCGRRTLTVKAQHKGKEHYRILAVCRSCNCEQTF
jgi:hypothetical protein